MTDEQHANRKCEWNLDACLEKLRPRRSDRLSSNFTAHSRPHIKDSDVTDDMLLEGYAILAGIVKLYGDQYLPIFERLHLEIENRKTTRRLIDKALHVAKDSTDCPQ